MTGTALTGSLGSLTLESLVRFLAENGLEGVLDVRNERGERGGLEISQSRLTGAWWGQAAGEPALAAMVAAAPDEFRFRIAATRAANVSGDITALFVRARAFAAALAPIAADAASPPAAAPSISPEPATKVDEPSFDATTTVVRIGQVEVRRGAPQPPPPPKPLAPQRARTIGSVWKPGDLVALANALIATYADGRYGGVIWERDLTPRIQRVDAREPLRPPLPVVAGRIDAVSLMRTAHSIDVIVPYLRAVVREVYQEADRSCSASAAQRGYRAAFQSLWGNDEELWTEALRLVEADRELRGRLTVTDGLPPRSVELVERDYAMGRGTTSDVVLPHGTVSRRHATITPRRGRYVLRDLGSTSGTLLNGVRVTQPSELSNGDTIQVGHVVLRFELLA
jgi:FHA domain-containing protein